MKKRLEKWVKKYAEYTPVASGVLLIILIAGGYFAYHLSTVLEATETELADTKTTLEGTIAKLELDNENLSEALYSEQQKNAQFEEQIGNIAETVGTLEKWSKLDPELLQKYSKVYFLNEHYIPPKLARIDEKYLTAQESEVLEIHNNVWPFLEDLLDDAKDDDLELLVASAYRSYGVQSSLKSIYSFAYGAGTANQFSADQGYSEHQLGTTVDFATPRTAATFSGFDDTEEYQWLLENAYKYGFALSYPEENGYYQFEPWHWRFVGKSLARELRREEKSFYDLDQRDIDQFLISIFD